MLALLSCLRLRVPSIWLPFFSYCACACIIILIYLRTESYKFIQITNRKICIRKRVRKRMCFHMVFKHTQHGFLSIPCVLQAVGFGHATSHIKWANYIGVVHIFIYIDFRHATRHIKMSKLQRRGAHFYMSFFRDATRHIKNKQITKAWYTFLNKVSKSSRRNAGGKSRQAK